MKSLEALLSNRWIRLEKNRELYYQIREDSRKFESFIKDKLGYALTSDSNYIKLDKHGVPTEEWMGIMEFKSNMSYVFLCLVLQFLENMDEGDQFILSELSEFIQLEFKEEEINWVEHKKRMALIATLNYCVQEGIIKVNDGSLQDYDKDKEAQVLYENTGLSKHMLRTFNQNIANLNSLEEFEELNLPKDISNNETFLRHRVYRKLLMTLGVLNTPETEEEFKYIRRHRDSIQDSFSELLDVNLHVHKNGAFLILGENSNFGRCLPDNPASSKISMECSLALLVNSYLRREIAEKRLRVDMNDNLKITKERFRELVLEARKATNIAHTKLCRDLRDEKFIESILAYYKEANIVKETENEYIFNSIIGKVIGRYDEEFLKVGNDNE